MNFFKNLPSNILKAIIGFDKLLINAGKDLIKGLVNGISNAKDAVINKIKDICSAALDKVKEFFGIKSPSRVMKKMGEYIMEGLGIGIEKSAKDVIRTMEDVSMGVEDAFDPNLTSDIYTGYSNFNNNGAVTGTEPYTRNNNITVNNYSPKALSTRETVREFRQSARRLNLQAQ